MFDSQQLGLVHGPLYISLFGHQHRMIEDDGRTASSLAVALGAHPSKICRLIVASDQHQEGFQLTKVADYQEFVRGDGVILSEPGSAALIQVADCAVCVLYSPVTKRVAVIHCGRPALTPFCKSDCGPCDWTVLEGALKQVSAGATPESVEVLVLGNICGACFKHDHEDAKPLIEPFLSLPPKVFDDHETKSLNLYEVIKHRLVWGGVPQEHIRHVGPCTFETAALSSHRRGDKDRNTIAVVWRE